MTDIRKTRDIEALLAESQGRYQSLMDNCVDGIIVIEEGGRILEFSRAAEEIFGYRQEEVIGRNVSLLMPEPDRSNHDHYINRYRETGRGQIIGIGREVVGLRKGGAEFPMDLSVGQMSNGSDSRFIGIVRDVSARQTAQQQLRQASKMEAVGQLTGGIAHDFNNLLAILKMDLEILESLCSEQEDALELVREAQDVTGTAADLTQRLLAFSRRQALSPTTVQPNELIGSLIGLLRRTLGEAISIDTVFASNVRPILVDSSQLESALLNLAVNARDAVPNGGRLLIAVSGTRIEAGERFAGEDSLSPGDYVSISVADSGAGIPRENMARVFEPFFTTKEGGHGTGLGLSMVYGFVRQSGGAISISSAPDEGTEIRLLFPVADTSAPASDGDRATAANVAGLTILLVEDHRKLRMRTAQVIRQMGHSVSEAANGEEARVLLNSPENAFDLVLSDIVMPGSVDGIEISEIAAGMEPPPRVILMTGYSGRLMDLPPGKADAILGKPFSRDELARAIADALGG